MSRLRTVQRSISIPTPISRSLKRTLEIGNRLLKEPIRQDAYCKREAQSHSRKQESIGKAIQCQSVTCENSTEQIDENGVKQIHSVCVLAKFAENVAARDAERSLRWKEERQQASE